MPQLSRHPLGRITEKSMIRKLLITIILSFVASSVHSQDTFSIWGNVGFGSVNHQFDEIKGGISGSYGFTARYSGYTLRYRLIDNSDLSIFSPAHELISRELLFGYAIHLTEEPKIFDLHLGLYVGVGSAEEVTPHYISSNGQFDDVYKNVSRFSTVYHWNYVLNPELNIISEYLLQCMLLTANFILCMVYLLVLLSVIGNAP